MWIQIQHDLLLFDACNYKQRSGLNFGRFFSTYGNTTYYISANMFHQKQMHDWISKHVWLLGRGFKFRKLETPSEMLNPPFMRSIWNIHQPRRAHISFLSRHFHLWLVAPLELFLVSVKGAAPVDLGGLRDGPLLTPFLLFPAASISRVRG